MTGTLVRRGRKPHRIKQQVREKEWEAKLGGKRKIDS